MPRSDPREVADTLDHLFRRRAGQMVATLTRIFGLAELDRIEDVVQEAMLKALGLWPYRGQPANPTAWLIQVARNLLLDDLRRRGRWRERVPEIERQLRRVEERSASEAAFAEEVRDDQLRMIFACCQPAIARDGQVALTLKTVCGFGTAEIARAFLTRRTTMAQRLVRAKRRLRASGARLAMPAPGELVERLDAVLEVLYLTFNEGYSASRGDDLVRADLCAEALRLAELVAGHPRTGEPRVHALAALFAFQAARLPARADAAGELLLLREQDRSLWDRRLIARGFAHLDRSAAGPRLSVYHLEAEIASCHVLAADFAATDWRRILAAYDRLMAMRPSPVVALNRAVALAQVEGATAGLAVLDPLSAEPALVRYYPLHAVRGELLAEVGQRRPALASYLKALDLSDNAVVRRFLERRIRALRGGSRELGSGGQA